MSDEALAMFPLGTVLLPSMVLPLQVFEDRYRVMVDDVLAADPPEIGVVLIERGSEVGGGDVRVDVGCVARIVEAARSRDGRWALECVGTRRIEVTEWLEDDPYPRALVRDLPDRDPLADRDGPGVAPSPTAGEVESLLRRVVALGTELGGPGLPVDLELSHDASTRSYQLGVLSPIGALDRQRVLVAAGPEERMTLLRDLLVEQSELLRARLGFGA